MARTSEIFTPSEIITVSELDWVWNSKLIYNDWTWTIVWLNVWTWLAIVWNDLTSTWWGWWHTIQDEWTPLAQRTNLNFVWAWVTVTDWWDWPNSTIVTIPWGGWDMLLWTVQEVTAEKKFDKDTLTTKGTSTGKVIISNANTSWTDYTATLQAKTGTIALTSDITWTNSWTNTWDNATNSQYSWLATSKQDTLVSWTNIKTINSTSLLWSWDIVIAWSSPLTTKWDLFTHSTVDARLPVWTDWQALFSDSTQTTGLKWWTIPWGWDMLLWTAQEVTALKTFDKDTLATKWTSTGKTTISTANTSATDYTTTLPAKTGTIAMTSDITWTNSWTNTWDVTLTAVWSTPNWNWASLSWQALTLQPADATNPWILSTLTQSILWAKTFLTKMIAPAIDIIWTAWAWFITLVWQSSNPTPPSAWTLLLHSTTTNWFTRLEQDNEATTNLVIGRDIIFLVNNNSWWTITKWQIVYANWTTWWVPTVWLARANSITTLAAIWVAVDNISDSAYWQVISTWILTWINTNTFSSWDTIYVSTATAGLFQNTRPSWTSWAFVQKIWKVLVQNATTWSILIQLAPFVWNMETWTTAATFAANAISWTTITTSWNIELWNASDTTISRVSAWVVAIEWVNIVKAWSITTDWITMNTWLLLWRWTASAGAIEEITLWTNLSLSWTTLNASWGWWGWFWTAVPWSPTRTSNTTFTIPWDYTTVFAKWMVLKWTESSTIRNAMISIPSTYGSPNTTVTIIWDTMASIDSSSLKYALQWVELFREKFVIAGSIWATGTDVANSFYAYEPLRVLWADLQVWTAWTTNNTTVDINKWWTTMFTTKPTLATTIASSPLPFTADTTIALALWDKVTIDIDAVQTTTATDLYVQLYLFPTRLNYLT